MFIFDDVACYLQQLENKKNLEETHKNYKRVDGETREVEDWKNQNRKKSKYKPKKRKPVVIIRNMMQEKEKFFLKNHDFIRKNVNKGLIYFYKPKKLKGIYCFHAIIIREDGKIIVDVFSDRKTRYFQNDFNTSLRKKTLDKEISYFTSAYLGLHRVEKKNIIFGFFIF